MSFFHGIKKKFKKSKLKSTLRKNKKLNIGSGPDGASKEYLGWVSVDMDYLDITKEDEWLDLVGEKNYLDNILAEHVWEHLTDEHTAIANKNCFEFLRKGGRLRIAVPDGYFPDPEYINQVKPKGTGLGSDDHKILYNFEIMQERLEKVGFTVERLEYFDNKGEFNHIEWDELEGYIKRSFKRDKRNKDGKIAYTSLIVDAIKK